MLAELRVASFGIIDHVTWSLSGGLNVITGETGAGKSLVIDAVEALLDGRLEEEGIRYGADGARVEAVFFLPQDKLLPQLKSILEEKGVSVDEDSLVLSCEFRRQGRSILRVNGSAVPRSLLRELGSLLVDIHGQSEHLTLFDRKQHLNYLDAYAHNFEKRDSFAVKVGELYHVEQELARLAQVEKERAHREEILRYQIDEIKRAKLKDGEEEEMERKRNILASCEKLKALAYEVCQALDGDDGLEAVVMAPLYKAVQALRRLVSLDPGLKAQSESLEGSAAAVQEIVRDIRAYEEGLEYDPQRLEEIDSRLELIRSLKKKYGATLTQVNEYLTRVEQEMEALASSVEEKARLEKERLSLKSELGQMAWRLSQIRQKTAKKLEIEVKKELADLNMVQVEFEVAMKQSPDEKGITLPDGQSYGFSKDGVDEIEFIVSTNPGELLKPLAAIASTGEISRFTLALKVALAEADSTPVLIFDEIDIGVGGRSGDIIGSKLWRLARHHQVICVTHLPQIAAFADAHYSVHKEMAGERITSLLEALDAEARVKELAVMLGGPRYTELALKNARELVQKAELWAKSPNHK